MDIQVLEPHGFCEGVVRAIQIAKKARSEHPGQTIHVLGWLVHNEEVIAGMEKDGFVFHGEKEGSLKDCLNLIPSGSVVVFAAHGHDPSLNAIAEDKAVIIYDATCHYVEANAATMKAEIHKGHDIIYIGQKNHAECVGALSIDPGHIFLCDPALLADDTSWKHLADPSPIVVSQTTMDMDDLIQAKQAISRLYPSLTFIDERCSATKRRQTAILLAEKNTDLFLILGSLTSNNTMKLVQIAKDNFPHADVIRALGLEEVISLGDLRHYQHVALASGASTSNETFQNVLSYLKSIR